MQRQVLSVYADRALYYWSRLHSQELKEGEGYETLRPNAGIHILNQSLFSEVPDYHLSFSLRCDQHHHLTLTRDLTIHTIELSKFSMNAEELVKPLEKWCYFLRHGEELEPEALPETLRTWAIEQAVETLQAMMRDAVQQEQYESWLKARRDRNALILDARREGLTEGRKEGLSEGERNTIEAVLELKFGEAGVKLMGPVRAIEDLAKLRELRQFLKSAHTLDEFRARLG